MLVIEHNLDVIKCADYLIDMGPEGGSGGGQVVASGTPEQVAAVPRSFTGQFLGPILAQSAPPVIGELTEGEAAPAKKTTTTKKGAAKKTAAPKKTAAKKTAAAKTAAKKKTTVSSKATAAARRARRAG